MSLYTIQSAGEQIYHTDWSDASAVLINFVRPLPLAGGQADIECGQIRTYIRPRKDILHSCKCCSPPLLWRVASPVAADMPSPALASHPSSEGLSERHLPPAKPFIPVASEDAAQHAPCCQSVESDRLTDPLDLRDLFERYMRGGIASLVQLNYGRVGRVQA